MVCVLLPYTSSPSLSIPIPQPLPSSRSYPLPIPSKTSTHIIGTRRTVPLTPNTVLVAMNVAIVKVYVLSNVIGLGQNVGVRW